MILLWIASALLMLYLLPSISADLIYNGTTGVLTQRGQLNVSGYNITTNCVLLGSGNWLCGYSSLNYRILVNYTNVTGEPWIEEIKEPNLNVNRSNWWDGLNTPADILASLINNDLQWARNCSVDNSCPLITYDSETTSWDKDSTNDVNTTTQHGGDVSGTYDAIQVLNTRGLTKANITDEDWVEDNSDATLTSLILSENLSVDNDILLVGYQQFTETSTPSNPPADNLRLYAKDDGAGTSRIYIVDSDGIETDLTGGGGGATNLDALSDVELSGSPYTEGKVLRADGSQYLDAYLDHSNLTGIGTNTHAMVDTHIANKSNPHSVTVAQIGAVATTGDENVDGVKTFQKTPLLSVPTPTSDNQVASKLYVDTFALGLSVRASCRAATTGDITLEDEQTIDNIAIVENDRVLVKDQTIGSQNGIYVCETGSWVRAGDYNESVDVNAGTFTSVIEGDTNGNSQWVQITRDPVLEVDTLVFTQLSKPTVYTASLGVEKSGNDFRADLLANGGLELTGNELGVNTDDSSIEKDGSGNLQVKAGGVTNAMLAGGIEDSKLNTITTADKADWDAVNKTGSRLCDMGDADPSLCSPSDNQAVTWDSASSKWVPEAVTGGSGEVSAAIMQWVVVPPQSTYIQWTNMPAATTELFASTAWREKKDLAYATKYRIFVGQTQAGYAGADLNLQYSADGISFSAADTGAAGEVDVGTGTGYKVGSWATLVAGAKSDVWLRIVGKQGNGAVDPRFNMIIVQFQMLTYTETQALSRSGAAGNYAINITYSTAGVTCQQLTGGAELCDATDADTTQTLATSGSTSANRAVNISASTTGALCSSITGSTGLCDADDADTTQTLATSGSTSANRAVNISGTRTGALCSSITGSTGLCDADDADTVQTLATSGSTSANRAVNISGSRVGALCSSITGGTGLCDGADADTVHGMIPSVHWKTAAGSIMANESVGVGGRVNVTNQLIVDSNITSGNGMNLMPSADTNDYFTFRTTANQIFLDQVGGSYIGLDDNANVTGILRVGGDVLVDGGQIGVTADTDTIDIGNADLDFNAYVEVDSNSNTQAIRLYGTAETTEICDLYVSSLGALTMSCTAGGDTSQSIDVLPEDNEYGFRIMESDGTGTAVYGNLYVVDATADYMNMRVTNVQSSTAGLFVTSGDRVGVGTSTPNQLLHVQGVGAAINVSATTSQYVNVNSTTIRAGGGNLFIKLG